MEREMLSRMKGLLIAGIISAVFMASGMVGAESSQNPPTLDYCRGVAKIDHEVVVYGFEQGLRSGLAKEVARQEDTGFFYRLSTLDDGQLYFYWMDGYVSWEACEQNLQAVVSAVECDAILTLYNSLGGAGPGPICEAP